MVTWYDLSFCSSFANKVTNLLRHFYPGNTAINGVMTNNIIKRFKIGLSDFFPDKYEPRVPLTSVMIADG